MRHDYDSSVDYTYVLAHYPYRLPSDFGPKPKYHELAVHLLLRLDFAVLLSLLCTARVTCMEFLATKVTELSATTPTRIVFSLSTVSASILMNW